MASPTTFYDSGTLSTGYLLKYSTSDEGSYLPESCLSQQSIAYLPSVFDPITHSWDDISSSLLVEEQLSIINPRIFSEVKTGFKNGDIKQTELKVYNKHGVY